eukprot:gene12734-biopygen2521
MAVYVQALWSSPIGRPLLPARQACGARRLRRHLSNAPPTGMICLAHCIPATHIAQPRPARRSRACGARRLSIHAVQCPNRHDLSCPLHAHTCSCVLCLADTACARTPQSHRTPRRHASACGGPLHNPAPCASSAGPPCGPPCASCRVPCNAVPHLAAPLACFWDALMAVRNAAVGLHKATNMSSHHPGHLSPSVCMSPHPWDAVPFMIVCMTMCHHSLLVVTSCITDHSVHLLG